MYVEITELISLIGLVVRAQQVCRVSQEPERSQVDLVKEIILCYTGLPGGGTGLLLLDQMGPKVHPHLYNLGNRTN